MIIIKITNLFVQDGWEEMFTANHRNTNGALSAMTFALA
jgi:hypothetical protein